MSAPSHRRAGIAGRGRHALLSLHRLQHPEPRRYPDFSDTPFADLVLSEIVGEGRRCIAFAASNARHSDLVVKVYRPTAIAKHARRCGSSIARYEYERNAALHCTAGLDAFIAAPVGFVSSPRAELFLQERVRGEPLVSYLRTSSAPRRAALLADIRMILQCAHRAGLFDLDLQPNNIIVRRNAAGMARPMLFDFNKVPYHVRPPNPAFGLLLRIGLLDAESRDRRYWKRLCRLRSGVSE